jgi:hypothetical protein
MSFGVRFTASGSVQRIYSCPVRNPRSTPRRPNSSPLSSKLGANHPQVAGVGLLAGTGRLHVAVNASTRRVTAGDDEREEARGTVTRWRLTIPWDFTPCSPPVFG